MKKLFSVLSPQLLLLATALVMSFIWDLGYSTFSFESAIGLLAALGAGIVLSLVSVRSPALRTMFVVLLFVCMLDIFFLQEAWQVKLILFVGLLFALRLGERFPSPVLVICGVVFSLQLLLQMPKQHVEKPVVLPHSDTNDTEFIVHIMLDELGSFDSIPPQYRNQRELAQVMRAYEDRGLKIYDNIRSIAPDTYQSMGVMLDTSFIDNLDGNIERLGRDAFRVRNNALHSRIASRGWHVSIVQPWYVDYCRPAFSCFTYSADSTLSTFESTLGNKQRFDVLKRQILTALISAPRGLWVLDSLPPDAFGEPLRRRGWRNPSLPFVATNHLAMLQDALVRGSGRQYVFAHILAPHFPWVFASDCSVKPTGDWRVPYHVDGRRDAMPGADAETFRAYWEQSICLHRKVIALVDAVDAAHPGRVSYIIHGDHGPRIVIRYIPEAGRQSLDEQTEKNLLATFVAARLSSNPASASTDTVLQTLIPALLLPEIEAASTGDPRMARH